MCNLKYVGVFVCSTTIYILLKQEHAVSKEDQIIVIFMP